MKWCGLALIILVLAQSVLAATQFNGKLSAKFGRKFFRSGGTTTTRRLSSPLAASKGPQIDTSNGQMHLHVFFPPVEAAPHAPTPRPIILGPVAKVFHNATHVDISSLLHDLASHGRLHSKTAAKVSDHAEGFNKGELLRFAANARPTPIVRPVSLLEVTSRGDGEENGSQSQLEEAVDVNVGEEGEDGAGDGEDSTIKAEFQVKAHITKQKHLFNKRDKAEIGESGESDLWGQYVPETFGEELKHSMGIDAKAEKSQGKSEAGCKPKMHVHFYYPYNGYGGPAHSYEYGNPYAGHPGFGMDGHYAGIPYAGDVAGYNGYTSYFPHPYPAPLPPLPPPVLHSPFLEFLQVETTLGVEQGPSYLPSLSGPVNPALLNALRQAAPSAPVNSQMLPPLMAGSPPLASQQQFAPFAQFAPPAMQQQQQQQQMQAPGQLLSAEEQAAPTNGGAFSAERSESFTAAGPTLADPCANEPEMDLHLYNPAQALAAEQAKYYSYFARNPVLAPHYAAAVASAFPVP